MTILTRRPRPPATPARAGIELAPVPTPARALSVRLPRRVLVIAVRPVDRPLPAQRPAQRPARTIRTRAGLAWQALGLAVVAGLGWLLCLAVRDLARDLAALAHYWPVPAALLLLLLLGGGGRRLAGCAGLHCGGCGR